MLTRVKDESIIANAIKNGAFDYVVKNEKAQERVEKIIDTHILDNLKN